MAPNGRVRLYALMRAIAGRALFNRRSRSVLGGTHEAENDKNCLGNVGSNEMGVPPALPGRQSNFENSGSIPPAVAFVFAEARDAIFNPFKPASANDLVVTAVTNNWNIYFHVRRHKRQQLPDHNDDRWANDL